MDLFQACVCVSPSGVAFLHINKHACKQISPVWIHAPSKPLVGVGRGEYTRFALGFVSLTLIPLHCFSCLGIVLSPSRLRTRMSRNSSLEFPASVKRASTGNRLLLIFPSHCCRRRRRCFKLLIHLLPFITRK